MKEKIFKRFLKYFLPLLLFIIFSIIATFLPYSGYIILTDFYILLMYYLFILFTFKMDKSSNDSVNQWLDRLDGSEKLCKDLFPSKKKKKVLENLEYVFQRLNEYTNGDKKKLRLLKRYFKTLNNEDAYDLFFKTFLGILVAVVIWGINKGSFRNIASVTDKIVNLDISLTYVSILNILVLIFEGVLFFVILINDYFTNKTRNRILVEIIEVCIEKYEDTEKK